MPFLIVETVENGSKKLSICPDGWVTNGPTGHELSWPMKKATKKCKTEDAVPKENWLQMRCVIKRTMNTYRAAEEELNEMVRLPETDQETYGTVNQSAADTTDDFNHIAEQLSSFPSIDTSTAVEHSTHEITIEESIENYLVVPNDPEDNLTNQNHTEEVLLRTQEVAVVDYDTIVMNQKILSDNQLKILDNQTKIMKFLATVSVKIDKIASNLVSTSHQPTNKAPTTQPQTVTKLSNEIKNSPLNTKFKPINSLDELQHMENELRDAQKREFYKDLYSVFCSPGKPAEYCAFQLIDILFTREFLVKCSWSGSAKGAGTKVAIKIFDEVLRFFFELVHDCDPSYTIDKNNDFFKSIVKNALKRVQAKLQRTSAPRKVPKRKLAPTLQTTKKSKQSEGSDDEKHEIIVTTAVIHEKASNEDVSVLQKKKSKKSTAENNNNEEKHAKLDGIHQIDECITDYNI